ncbi:MAG: hypothetical protein ACREDY_07145, partial [Bradyrhizobium sp.]
ELYDSWLAASAADQQARIWHEMLGLWAEEVYSIGLTAGVQQPVVVNARLRNVPRDGMYNWDPGAHFGIYKADGFWFDESKKPAESAALSPEPR